jgi:hypothetical protein
MQLCRLENSEGRAQLPGFFLRIPLDAEKMVERVAYSPSAFRHPTKADAPG